MSYLTEICSNSVKGKAFGSASLNYLRSNWMNTLRADIANNGGADSIFNPKGDQSLALNDYLLSKGSLRSIIIKPFTMGNGLVIDTNATASKLSFSDVFPNVKLGHQLTFIAAYKDMATKEIYFGYARVAAKTNEDPFLYLDSGSGLYKINTAAINTTLSEGNWDNIFFDLDAENGEISISAYVTPEAGDTTPVVAGAIIVSDKKTGNRSTTRLSVATNIHNDYPANWVEAAATYGATSSQVDAVSDVYLNNSVDVPEANNTTPLQITKVYEQGDVLEEPVERWNLLAGRSYNVEFNKDITSVTSDPVVQGFTATKQSNRVVDITIESNIQSNIPFVLVVDGSRFGSFVCNA